MTARNPTHRIVCADHTIEVVGLQQAERSRAAADSGACRLPHMIEALVDGLWMPLHLLQARQILAASVGAAVGTPDGQLIKTFGGWSQQAGERADSVADASRDPHAWIAALGPHERTVLTVDGRGARLDGWCTCHRKSLVCRAGGVEDATARSACERGQATARRPARSRAGPLTWPTAPARPRLRGISIQGR